MKYVENGLREDCAKLCFKGMTVPLCELSQEEYREIVYGLEVAEQPGSTENISGKSIVSEKNNLFNVSVQKLGLTARAVNCLRRADIKTIGRLLDFSEAELLKLRNMGDKSLDEIKDKLAAKGLKLKKVL